MNFNVEKEMQEEFPWLTEDYVKKNAFHSEPFSVEEMEKKKPFFLKHRQWGNIPCKSRDEIRVGDIIIFDEYEEKNTGQENFETDRFSEVYDEMIQEYWQGKNDLLPVGVIVHPPGKKFAFLLENLTLYLENENFPRINEEVVIKRRNLINVERKKQKIIDNFFFKKGKSQKLRDNNINNYEIKVKIANETSSMSPEGSADIYKGFVTYLT